jgi:hypothetical protein
MAEIFTCDAEGTLLFWRTTLLKQSDIETNPDFAYDWAMRGIEFERARILKALLEISKNGQINEPWSVIERKIMDGILK